MSHTRGEMLRAGVVALAVGMGLLAAGTARGVSFTDFSEAGAVINGYQDDFNGATRAPVWRVIGNDVYAQTGDGTLKITTAGGDPNKLLYDPTGVTYNNTTQEVLALMRVNTSSVNDAFRSGVTALADPTTGQGFNLHFREDNQNGPGRHFNLLDDLRAWGPASAAGGWDVGQYFWLRLLYRPDAPIGTNNLADGINDAFGKVWRAGTGEPANFEIAWDRANRSGLAGLAGPVADGETDVSVDYVLIKAEGLPAIRAVPEPAAAAGLLLGVGPLGLLSRRRRA